MISVVRKAICKRSAQGTIRFFSKFDQAKQPRIRIGSVAPNFQAQTTAGKIDFHEYLSNKWTVLFSHPADFTPVCTTELGLFAKLAPEFAKLNTQLIGLSADEIKNHEQWVKDIEELTSEGAKVNYPIIADTKREIAFLYDMVDQAGFENLGDQAMTIRNVFIIDPSKKVRLLMVYPASTGRNVSEVLRVVRALQLADKKGIATPVDWVEGDDVIVPPSVSTEEARKKFGEIRELKPYLRYVKIN